MTNEALVIARSIAATLPNEADARDELIALGLVTTGVICAVAQEDRAELVEAFCKALRKGVAGELN